MDQFKKDLEHLANPNLPPQARYHLVLSLQFHAMARIIAILHSGEFDPDGAKAALLEIKKKVDAALTALG